MTKANPVEVTLKNSESVVVHDFDAVVIIGFKMLKEGRQTSIKAENISPYGWINALRQLSSVALQEYGRRGGMGVPLGYRAIVKVVNWLLQMFLKGSKPESKG